MGAPTNFIFLGTVLVLTLVQAEPTCLSTNPSEMRVTFDSHRNKTGLWTHEIGLEHQGFPRGPNNSKNTAPWTVDVKYAPKNCEDKQEKTLKVLIYFSESRFAADYEFIPGLGYYKYYPTQVPWDAAKTTCEQDGAHLAIINSQQEADALKKMVVNASVDWAWLGLVKNGSKGEFFTVKGDPLSTAGFAKWHAGANPANAAPNSAAVIHKSQGNLAYDPTPTSTRYVFICEQD